MKRLLTVFLAILFIPFGLLFVSYVFSIGLVEEVLYREEIKVAK